VTEIYLCNVCSCQEILRRNGRGQLEAAAKAAAASAAEQQQQQQQQQQEGGGEEEGGEEEGEEEESSPPPLRAPRLLDMFCGSGTILLEWAAAVNTAQDPSLQLGELRGADDDGHDHAGADGSVAVQGAPSRRGAQPAAAAAAAVWAGTARGGSCGPSQ
jgi:hypothetical protein